MRRLALLFVVLLSGAAAIPAPSVGAQDRERDVNEAAATAAELFQLAADGKFNALYDYIHPDAHAVVPRIAAVGTFEQVYTIAQPGRVQLVSGEIVEWTYGVTGKTYDYTAAIDYTMPYTDENGEERVLEETMYLVRTGYGWRWFFGTDATYVQAAIDTFGQGQVHGTALAEGDLIGNVVNDLDAFWRDVVSYTSFTYRTPGVVVVAEGDREDSACGPAQTGFWGFYCPPDQTIYLDEALLLQLQQQADFAAAFVIAHEWAHHAQTGVGFQRADPGETPDEWDEVYSIELELIADCFAGAWAQDVETRGRLESDDIRETIDFTVEYLGDPSQIDPFDPQAHGTAEQRSTAIMSGYQNGFEGCNLVI